jgi:hypothetical protein
MPITMSSLIPALTQQLSCKLKTAPEGANYSKKSIYPSFCPSNSLPHPIITSKKDRSEGVLSTTRPSEGSQEKWQIFNKTHDIRAFLMLISKSICA